MTRSPAGEAPLATLLVGAGEMGAVWLRALVSPEARGLGVRLVGVCDLALSADAGRDGPARAPEPGPKMGRA